MKKLIYLSSIIFILIFIVLYHAHTIYSFNEEQDAVLDLIKTNSQLSRAFHSILDKVNDDTDLRQAEKNFQVLIDGHEKTMITLENVASKYLDLSTNSFIFMVASTILITLFSALYLNALKEIADFKANKEAMFQEVKSTETNLELKNTSLTKHLTNLTSKSYSSLDFLNSLTKMFAIKYLGAHQILEILQNIRFEQCSRTELYILLGLLKDSKAHFKRISSTSKLDISSKADVLIELIQNRIGEIEKSIKQKFLQKL